MFNTPAKTKGKAIVLLICFVFSFMLTSLACAAELRVLDVLGLVRASTHIEGPAIVVVTARTSELPQEISLVNVDGLTAAVTAKNNGGTYHFKAVTEGSWKIDAPESLAIVEVKIVQ